MESLMYKKDKDKQAVAIQMKHVQKVYNGFTRCVVFQNLNLEIKSGEFVAAVGPIGCGKTTLINLIAGFERPTSGSIFLDGFDITRLDDDRLADLRTTKIGIVHQVQRLFPELTVLQNIEFPLLLKGIKNEQRKAQAMDILNRLGIAGQKDKKVSTLSIGERQMVCIARAMVFNPPIILMDEPTEMLDPVIRELVLSLIRGDNLIRGKTVLITTHDRKIMEMAHRVIRVKKSIP
ncbi:MAG: ABC transporter ATP-binding protein [Nitrososphaerales archaeon]|nr:ABC transporter ATP-binding protein [Nitrososphaerales archaeon]